MRSVRYAVAMSLDGFIAGPNGESDWIVMDPAVDFQAFFDEVDTLLLGRKTYQAMQHAGSAGDVPAMPGMQVYVFSRTLHPADCPDVRVSDDPQATLHALRARAGKDIWLFGGGALFGSLLQLGLVDRVEVAIMPVLLGRGVPLLAAEAPQAELQLVQQRVLEQTGTVSLEYAVISPRS